jgi:hypothetical protein
MNYELALYDLTLLVVGVVNIAMATGLLMNNYTYRHYPVYHRSRMLTAVFFAVFGIGLILHYHYHWRQACPPLATALSLTYFHIAGVAVTWSHTSLLNPRYLSRRVAARDIAFLAIGIPTYWLTAMFNVPGSMFIFLLHAVWMTYDFYTAYYRIRHRLRGIQSSTQHARCFRWMLLSCHLIIAFGIGSIYTETEENLVELTEMIEAEFPAIYASGNPDMLFCLVSTDETTWMIWYGEGAEKAVRDSFPEYDGGDR